MAQGAHHEQLLAEARERFDAAEDFTVSVEEEFALLDPETLELVNRFEEVQAAAKGTALEPNLVGELIASEVEVKTGKQPSFADVPSALAERRAELAALVEPLGLALGATGTHPWSSWRDQRIIDTPHYRRNDELLRTSSGATTPSAPHPRRDPGRRPRRPGRRRAAELAARAARRVGELPVPRGRRHGAPLGEDPGVHALLPPLRRAGRVRVVGRARGLRAVSLRDGVGRRADTALVERPSAPRLPDRRDPHLRRAARSRRGAVARRADGLAHRALRPRARRGRAAAEPSRIA